MAYGKGFFVLFALVASHGFVLAQEASNSASSDASNQAVPQSDLQAPLDHDHDRASSIFSINNGLGHLPNFSDFLGNSSTNPFSQFVSTLGQIFPIPGLSNNNNSSSSSFPFLGSFGRSQPLDLLPGLENESSPQDRFFFHSHFSVPIGCNYTTQAGYSCAGCREQLICSSNGVGRLRVCPFYAPYCYNGVCGSLVNSTCTNSTG